jgi:hypothetical protein
MRRHRGQLPKMASNPGSSKEPAMFIGLVIVAILVLYLGLRLRRKL